MITPTPWPAGDPANMPFDASIIGAALPNAVDIAEQAVGIWNQFMSPAWESVSGLFLVMLVFAALMAIGLHISRLGEDNVG